jgi:hypothetical protein
MNPIDNSELPRLPRGETPQMRATGLAPPHGAPLRWQAGGRVNVGLVGLPNGCERSHSLIAGDGSAMPRPHAHPIACGFEHASKGGAKFMHARVPIDYVKSRRGRQDLDAASATRILAKRVDIVDGDAAFADIRLSM